MQMVFASEEKVTPKKVLNFLLDVLTRFLIDVARSKTEIDKINWNFLKTITLAAICRQFLFIA